MRPAPDGIQLLLIEDDESVVELLREVAEREGFELAVCRDGDAGYAEATASRYDLLILDIMLPRMDGWQICRNLRRQGNDLPTIMLTAKADEDSRVMGLELGADDYVTKPFSPRELVARIRTVLKRAGTQHSVHEALRFPSIDLVIDPTARMVSVGRRCVPLAPREFDLLYFLARNRDTAFSRTTILREVWGRQDSRDARTVNEHVKRLRHRLEEAGVGQMPLQTVWGTGYRFTVEGE